MLYISFLFSLYSGNLQLGPPAATTIPAAGMWGASTAAPSMFPMPGVAAPGPRFGFQQPSAFGGLPIPPTAWGQPMPPQLSPPPLSPPHIFCQPPPTGPAAAGTNPFLPGAFPGDQQGPSRPPPRAPGKEATPKVENSAFTALDPLGDKERKSGKDMFKDFQIAKPPAIPARKGEIGSNSAAAPSSNKAFDQYFSSKVGLAQDTADHDDFDINQISAVNGSAFSPNFVNCHVCDCQIYDQSSRLSSCACLDVPKPAPAAVPGLTPGLAAFSSAPVANNEDMFDKAFGAPDSSPFGVPPVAMVQRFTHVWFVQILKLVLNILRSPFLHLAANGHSWSDFWLNSCI